MTECPPVLLIAWQRYGFARQVFERIREARPARLYLAVDGIHPGTESCGWEATRGLAQEVDWPCEVKCRFLASNEGCRFAVSGAISWFFENEEEGIMLEEDCLPHPSFFAYCREALERYRNEPRVMQICGTNLFADLLPTNECRFSTSAAPWGWASWRRAWQSHDTRMDSPVTNWGDPSLRDWLGSAAAVRLWAHRQKACEKKWVNSWDFPWELHVISQRGLFLHPAVNLVDNIGFGDNSTHTTEVDSLVDSCPASPHPLPLVFPAQIEPDASLMRLHTLTGLREFTRQEFTLADATRDLLDCRQPAKDIRKTARKLEKWVATREREASKPRRGFFRGKPLENDVHFTRQGCELVEALDDAAARIEGRVETREIHCKSATGGKYLHGNLSFAQEGEDRVLARVFGEQAKGFYIDVGAHHPFRFSNTWLLYQRGWRGINIDPGPDVIQEFLIWRPRDINLQLGIADQPGELPFYAFEEKAYGTFSRELATQRAAGGIGGGMSTTSVTVLPMRDILARHLPPGTEIDLMTIDTEGFEPQVLAGMDWDSNRPRILLCERLGEKDLLGAAEDPLVRYLTDRSYRFFAATFNTFFFEDQLPRGEK